MTQPGTALADNIDIGSNGAMPGGTPARPNGTWQRRLWIMHAGCLALLVAALVAIVAIAVRTQDADAWVAHTLEVRQASGALFSIIQDAESSVRGYLLRGDPETLRGYDPARIAVPAAEKRLRALVQDNPEQVARLDSLAPLIERRLDLLATSIAFVHNGELQALADRLRVRGGIAAMNQIRAALAGFDQAEVDLLARRAKIARSAHTQLLVGSSSALSLALLLGVLATILSQRQAGGLRAANARLVGTVSDRTNALRDRDARLHLAVEAAGLGVYETDVPNRIVRGDARAAAITGGAIPADLWLDLDGPEVVGWRASIHPDDAAARAAVRNALYSGTSDQATDEYRLQRKDGSWSWISTFSTISERDPDTGKALRVLTMVQDITHRKNIELELRHAQRLEAIGQLTGGIAHDFNNLLGAILGCAEFLLDRVQDRPEEHDLATEILDSALHGAALTQRLLAFARRQPLQPAVIDLNEYLPANVSLLRHTLGETIIVEVTQAPALWLTHSDPSQIADVLLNLAINARDAMPHGGTLTIQTANAVLDAAYCARNSEVTPGEYVVLSVNDTGTGMTPDVLARAMEPFFTTKPTGKGTGLGLSMIYGFARQSGGHLSIDSKPGAGATVRLFLPRTEANKTAPAVQQAWAAPMPRGHETILVVDDNVDMRTIAARNLTALGYDVRTAVDGPEALAILRTGEPFDLLFTDVIMPNGVSGYELADAAKELQPSLSILFTTGFAANSEGDPTVWNSGALAKPYRRRELADRVRAVLDAA